MRSKTLLHKTGLKYLLGVALFFAFTQNAGSKPAGSAPAFNAGSSQLIMVCKNSGGTGISTSMSITDADVGQTETWTVTLAPTHGTLSGFPVSLTSTGSSIAPGGVTYTPAPGYTGADVFAVQVSDGSLIASTTVNVNVSAGPALTSTLTPPAICNNTVFSYSPTSATGGATFNWYRAYVPGISNPSASGTNNPNELLSNFTNYDITVTYAYTITSGGCSNHQNVTVTVHPAIRLSSSTNDTICSGSVFNYTPASYVPGATFSWSRATVAGILPSSSSGADGISETLTNTSGSAVNTIYYYALTAGGCTGNSSVNVLVVPPPANTSITTHSPSVVCSGTHYQNFGTTSMPPAGMTYTWGAVNADLNGVGSTNQYCLVSFPFSGNAMVTLTINAGANCIVQDTFGVIVSGAVSGNPDVIYYNYQFVCLDNTLDSYQWGYDDASTLAPANISGAAFQSYVNAAPDFINRYYWVITTKNGCMQKTYFNAPSAVKSVNANAGGLHVYPDPAQNNINVETGNHQQGGIAAITITDMLGKIVKTQNTAGATTQIDIASLPAGCYLINCTQNGLKTGTARFIKN